MYLFGGISQEPITNMATIITGHNRSSAKYRMLEQDSQTGLAKVKGVFGLGACTYKDKMFFFFGGLGF